MSLRRDIAANLFGRLAPLATSFITIPIYLQLIGEERYGVLSIAWLLLGYFGLFDLGLGRATAQQIAAEPDATELERAETFWTALVLNVGFGVVGALVMWPLASAYFERNLDVTEVLRPELQAAAPWLSAAVPVATLAGVLTGALQGRRRFIELNLTSVAGTVLLQVLPVLVAWGWSPDLRIILPVTIGTRLLVVVALLGLCARHVFGAHVLRFSRQRVGALMSFGGWITVTSFVGPLMVALDRFVIGALSGAKAVSHYTVPFQLGERTLVLSAAMNSALFPRLAAASPEEQRHLARQGLRSLLVVTTPPIVFGIFIIQPFLALWISPEFAQAAAGVGPIVLLGFWLNGFARIPYTQLQARGRPDQVALCHVAELVPYLALLYVGLQVFGIEGAAAVFSIRVLVDLGLLSWLAGTLPALVAALWAPLLMVAAACAAAMALSPGDGGWWAVAVALMLVTVGWSWWQAPPTLRHTARRFVPRRTG